MSAGNLASRRIRAPFRFRESLLDPPADPEECWIWNGVWSVRVPMYWDTKQRREVDARRLVYRLNFPLRHREQLLRSCESIGCVSPSHHVALTSLEPREQVMARLRHKVSVVPIEGREHWFWRGQPHRWTDDDGDLKVIYSPSRADRARISVGGRNRTVVRWAWEVTHGGRVPQGRLSNRLDICGYGGCVNPDCWGMRKSFARLYQVVDRGYRTRCRIGRGNRNNKGYVRFGRGYLHRATYAAKHGPIAKDMELHHLCGQPDCCSVNHLVPMSRSRHLREHGKKTNARSTKGVSQTVNVAVPSLVT